MRIEASGLGAALQREIPPLVFVHGDETLLVEETCETYLGCAREAGYREREIRFVEGGFVWESLLEDSMSMSLFGDRKVVDVRMVNLRMESGTADVLKALASSSNPDTRVLLRAGELNGDQRKAAWYKALEQKALVVHVRGIEADRFVPWLVERLRRAGVRLERDALELFSTRVEGNLLAAVQEIERLKLLDSETPIDRARLESVLEDSSHHNTFAWIDALLQGDGERAARVLNNLRQEGQSFFGPLYLLVGTLRRIDGNKWMPEHQKRLLPGFRRRAGPLDAVLAECALLDLQGKGQLTGEPWESLLSLSLRICGRTLPQLGAQRHWLRR